MLVTNGVMVLRHLCATTSQEVQAQLDVSLVKVILVSVVVLPVITYH
ncbi:Uncharacterised protein [Mycobacterium tuberculosis]|nr:Uncharacterised protein [Mycobacterium tuberculosis]